MKPAKTPPPIGNPSRVQHDESPPKTKIISAIIFLFFLLMFVVYVAVYWATDSYDDYLVREAYEGVPMDQKVQQLREREQRELSTYGIIDEEKKLVRIPIEEAMQTITKEYKR